MLVMEGWRKKAIVGVKETMSRWEMVEDHEEESGEGGMMARCWRCCI